MGFGPVDDARVPLPPNPLRAPALPLPRGRGGAGGGRAGLGGVGVKRALGSAEVTVAPPSGPYLHRGPWRGLPSKPFLAVQKKIQKVPSFVLLQYLILRHLRAPKILISSLRNFYKDRGTDGDPSLPSMSKEDPIQTPFRGLLRYRRRASGAPVYRRVQVGRLLRNLRTTPQGT